jgi:CheY-like chemotaxis protein
MVSDPSRRRVTWGSPGRVLVVDGDEDHAAVLTAVLEAQGYRVDQARSAEEGLTRLRGERYALLLVHYGLPDRTGTWLLKEAREEGILHGAAELMFTGKPWVDGTPDVKVLRKPLDLPDVVRQVNSIVGRPEGPGPSSPDVRAPRAGDAPASPPHEAKIELSLYVTLPWPSSVRAQSNLSRVLSGIAAGEVRLQVWDLATHPERGEEDNVLFSPTLVKVWPEPKMWILGDLSEPGVLTDLLALCGVDVPAGPARRPRAIE